MNKIENNMYYQTNIKTSRNKDINFLQLSYGNFVSLDDYILLEKENQQLKEQYCERTDCSGRLGNSKKIKELEQENLQLKKRLQQKEVIINKIEDYIIKNNLFNYKYDEEELYEIVTDDKARTDLLEILKSKGEVS